jgi:hypothetical protein
MSRFTSNPGLRQLEYSDGRPASRNGLGLFGYIEPLHYELAFEGSDLLRVVPAFDFAGLNDAVLYDIERGRLEPRGMTDFGSIPWFGRWAVAPSDPVSKAFGLHDDDCSTRGEAWRDLIGRPATSAEVHRELRTAMLALGAPKWKRTLVYNAVSVGGPRWN